MSSTSSLFISFHKVLILLYLVWWDLCPLFPSYSTPYKAMSDLLSSSSVSRFICSIYLHISSLLILEPALLLSSFLLFICFCTYCCCIFLPCMHHGYSNFFNISTSIYWKAIFIFLSKLYALLTTPCMLVCLHRCIHVYRSECAYVGELVPMC